MFSLNSGICYVQGKRIEVPAIQNLITDIDSNVSDKIFIAIDINGVIKFEPCTPDCICPFEPSEVCILSCLEFDSTNVYNIDLRLFIDHLDLKILNAITVSPQAGLGHFSSFGSAVKYARRFAEMFPNAGTPTIHLKSGIYEITVTVDDSDITFSDWLSRSSVINNTELYDILYQEGLIIDFPVNIIGEGNSSELKIRNHYIFSDVTHDMRGFIAVVGNGFTSFTVPITKFTEGFINFKDFAMDNCRFAMPDLNITDGVDDFLMGINIDSIIFNMRDFTSNTFDDSIGPRCISLFESDDTSANKGNLTVNNCQFWVEDGVANRAIINLPNAARTKNLTISNNRILGNGDTSLVRLLSTNIWAFTTADSGANITILGNTPGSNHIAEGTANNPHMILGTTGWGDRLNRALKIGGSFEAGGDLTAEGSGTFNDEVEGSEFNYNVEFTRTKYIFFENLAHSALGNGSAGTSLSSLSVNGRTWRTVEFADNLTDFMLVRLEVQLGETLDEVNIILATEDPADAVFGGYDLRITSENAFGDSTTEQAYTSMGAVSGGLGGSAEAASQGVSGLGFAGAQNKHYIAAFRRNVTTGFAQHILYVQYKTTLNTVQALGGLV